MYVSANVMIINFILFYDIATALRLKKILNNLKTCEKSRNTKLQTSSSKCD